MEHYDGLGSLLEQDPQARQFYDSLPDYVRDMISQRPQGVNSLDSLQSYADNLLAGDR